MQRKLTLRLNKQVIEEMKLYAFKHHESLSALTERLYLSQLKQEPNVAEELSPLAKKYKGLLKDQQIPDEEIKTAYLFDKHSHG